jgi:predicted unusual protein kinase regulating ubiquinone biosynthesis (AarF/ABC1/UbiB family)/HPt (histidine-containing phosphotransfer) domain-containing protein
MKAIIDQSSFSSESKEILNQIFKGITKKTNQSSSSRMKTSNSRSSNATSSPLSEIKLDSVNKPPYSNIIKTGQLLKINLESFTKIKNFLSEIRPLTEILNTPEGSSVSNTSLLNSELLNWVNSELGSKQINEGNCKEAISLVHTIKYNLTNFGYSDKINFQVKDKRALAQSLETLYIQNPNLLKFIFAHTNLIENSGSEFSSGFKETLLNDSKFLKILGRNDLQNIFSKAEELIQNINKFTDEQLFDALCLIYYNRVSVDNESTQYIKNNLNSITQRIDKVKKPDRQISCKELLKDIFKKLILEDKKQLSGDDYIELFKISSQAIDQSDFPLLGGLCKNQIINNLTKEQLKKIIDNGFNSHNLGDLLPVYRNKKALQQRFCELVNLEFRDKKSQYHFNFASSSSFLTERPDITTSSYTRDVSIGDSIGDFLYVNSYTIGVSSLDSTLFIDRTGKELNDADKQTLIALTPPNQQSYYLQTYLSQKEKKGEFTQDLLSELYNKLDSATPISVNSPNYKPPLSEAPGFSMEDSNRKQFITVRDMAFHRYFHNHLQEFQKKAANEANREILNWFGKYYPDSTSYRDTILNRIYNHGAFEQIQDKEIQKEILSLFHDDNKASGLKLKFYDQHSGRGESSQEDLNFLFNLYPEASPERDKQIEKILDSHPFTLKELNGIWDKFSDNNLKYLQKSDSAQTWYEELCSRLEPNEKSDLFLWMIGKQKNKPSSIRNEESYLGVNMDEIKDLFKFKSFRDNQVRALFAGQKGLFAKSNEFTLDRLLDQVLQDYFVKDQDKDLNKLKDIVQFSIKEIFHLENNSKKLLFMQDLADLIGADEKKDFEDFVCKTLSISPVFAKLGQALGSQVELKSKFPKLYEKLQSLKDDMSPLSYTILKKAIDTIPELADQDITIEKRIGTASIKGVWKINLNGEEYALKIRKPAIQELLEEEREEFRTLAEKITPKIKDAYALEHIPDLEKRIFYALSQECDLENEIRNNKKLNEILGQNQNNEYQHSTPVINSQYSNSILVLDEFSQGDNLTKLQQEKAPNQKVIEKEISQAFWKQALACFIHGDPHSSNFIITENKIKWIDTGLCIELPEKLKGFLQDPELKKIFQDFSFKEILETGQALSQYDVSKLNFKNPFALLGQLGHLLKNPEQRNQLQKAYSLYQIAQKHQIYKPIEDFIQRLGKERLQNIYQKVESAELSVKPLVLLNELDKMQDIEKPLFIDLFLLALGRGSYLFENAFHS